MSKQTNKTNYLYFLSLRVAPTPSNG